MQLQSVLFDSFEYYARCPELNGFYSQLLALHPDEDNKAYWMARREAERLGRKYGICFVVYSTAHGEYRFIDWQKWKEEYEAVTPWFTIGYYEKDNGWFD